MAMTIVACKQAIPMKTLVLTTHQIESDSITHNLQSYGIPYDIVEFTPTKLLEGNLTLYEENEPKYNLVVINGGDLILEIDNIWKSALTTEQWAYLEEYESKYSVRRVVLSEDVPYNSEVELNDPNNWGESLDDQPLLVEKSDEIKGIFDDARIKINAPLNVDGIYHTRVKIVNTDTTTPFLYYSDNGKEGPVAAIITKYENGREKMSFFFGFGSWSQSSVILNHLWLTWGTRSLFNGFRRVYFTPHIDDVFLSTELVDPINNEIYPEDGDVFRTKAIDFQKIVQFQKDVLDVMPKGSFYRAELAFNGNGLLIEADYDLSIQIDTERYCDLEYVMEPGKGESRWPKENYKLSSAQNKVIEKDDLYKFFYHNETIQKEFFWSSHTFTHENLDNVSRSDVDNEIRLNIEIAEKLGLVDKEYWSGHSIITPQISGLHSKDALETFMKYGINSATGDLSRSQITNLENPYLPFYTTLESSNLEGFPVIPRTPTEIYYFCSTKEEDTYIYNEVHYSDFGRDSTFDEIMEREAKRTTLLMTELRHEAHQFHQANIRYYPKVGNYGESLLEDWTRSVVSYYTKFVDWPLISISLNKQAETFIERAKLDACGHETKFIIEENKVVGVSVSASKGECTVPITVPIGVKNSSLPKDAKLEQIGNDPLTVWIPLKKGETKSFELEPAFEWRINESSVDVESTTSFVESSTIAETTTVVESTIVDVEPTTVIESSTNAETTTVDVELTTSVVESSIVDAESTSTIVESTAVDVEPTSTIVESTTVDVESTSTIVESTTVDVEPTSTIAISTTVDVEPTSTVAESTSTVVEPISTIVESTSINEATTSTKTITKTITSTTTSTIKPTDTCGNAPFYRCGGIGYVGSNCCTEGFVCKYQNPYYYQCVSEDSIDYDDPTELPIIITTTSPVEQPTELPTEESDPCENGHFAKCGGVGFTGSKCCKKGFICQVQNKYYHQCVALEDYEEPMETTIIEEPTSTSVAEPTEEPETCENEPFARCGGIGFKGPTCCSKGHVCFPHNDYYYQCISIDSVDQFESKITKE
ncbi:hypothetical protein BCR36DRAFT_587375 [Piromyces finnis]|uniref:CBM1 domain-containing protein n=1 Tax=Piromyces finnis TaxID=1754191 RepID=A0A1Y1UW58_9FUNG|nr:hypothetical protein BCR36DRAFT_587375 [Piromyces finnis]|eukprot:ORX42189.1 hypothetical protein BCR36DRAFT_587375 [Piromyces finnis]